MNCRHNIFIHLILFSFYSSALEWFRGSKDVESELAEMRREHAKEEEEERVSIIGLFKTKALRRPLIISIVMQLSQQLSGINAVSTYRPFVYVKAVKSAGSLLECAHNLGMLA